MAEISGKVIGFHAYMSDEELSDEQLKLWQALKAAEQAADKVCVASDPEKRITLYHVSPVRGREVFKKNLYEPKLANIFHSSRKIMDSLIGRGYGGGNEVGLYLPDGTKTEVIRESGIYGNRVWWFEEEITKEHYVEIPIKIHGKTMSLIRMTLQVLQNDEVYCSFLVFIALIAFYMVLVPQRAEVVVSVPVAYTPSVSWTQEIEPQNKQSNTEPGITTPTLAHLKEDAVSYDRWEGYQVAYGVSMDEHYAYDHLYKITSELPFYIGIKEPENGLFCTVGNILIKPGSLIRVVELSEAKGPVELECLCSSTKCGYEEYWDRGLYAEERNVRLIW